jgi:hypothetical protein
MVSSDPTVVGALQTLLTVFTKYGRTVLANYIQEVLQAYDSGSPEFDKRIASAEMWGGAGSVCDNPPPQGTPDRRLFFQAIITLANYINAQKIGHERARQAAESIASTFRQWLALGL